MKILNTHPQNIWKNPTATPKKPHHQTISHFLSKHPEKIALVPWTLVCNAMMDAPTHLLLTSETQQIIYR